MQYSNYYSIIIVSVVSSHIIDIDTNRMKLYAFTCAFERSKRVPRFLYQVDRQKQGLDRGPVFRGLVFLNFTKNA